MSGGDPSPVEEGRQVREFFPQAPEGSRILQVGFDHAREGTGIPGPGRSRPGPRDAAGVPGAVENALRQTPTADPDNPLEILRVVHSFDPCIACGVHVIKKEEV